MEDLVVSYICNNVCMCVDLLSTLLVADAVPLSLKIQLLRSCIVKLPADQLGKIIQLCGEHDHLHWAVHLLQNYPLQEILQQCHSVAQYEIVVNLLIHIAATAQHQPAPPPTDALFCVLQYMLQRCSADADPHHHRPCLLTPIQCQPLWKKCFAQFAHFPASLLVLLEQHVGVPMALELLVCLPPGCGWDDDCGVVWQWSCDTLLSEDGSQRKLAAHMLHRLCHTATGEAAGTLQQRRPPPAVLALLSVLEEKQTHVIMPTLKKHWSALLQVWRQPPSGAGVTFDWLKLILQRALMHESARIHHWAITQLLEAVRPPNVGTGAPANDDVRLFRLFVQDLFCALLNSTRLFTYAGIAATNQEEEHAPALGEQAFLVKPLEHFMRFLCEKEDLFDQEFWHSWCSSACQEAWAPIPLLFLTQALTTLPNAEANQSIQLNIAGLCHSDKLRTVDVQYRLAIQSFVIRASLAHPCPVIALDVSIMGDAFELDGMTSIVLNLFLHLHDFHAILRPNGVIWKTVIDFLRLRSACVQLWPDQCSESGSSLLFQVKKLSLSEHSCFLIHCVCALLAGLVHANLLSWLQLEGYVTAMTALLKNDDDDAVATSAHDCVIVVYCVLQLAHFIAFHNDFLSESKKLLNLLPSGGIIEMCSDMLEKVDDSDSPMLIGILESEILLDNQQPAVNCWIASKLTAKEEEHPHPGIPTWLLACKHLPPDWTAHDVCALMGRLLRSLAAPPSSSSQGSHSQKKVLLHCRLALWHLLSRFSAALPLATLLDDAMVCSYAEDAGALMALMGQCLQTQVSSDQSVNSSLVASMLSLLWRRVIDVEGSGCAYMRLYRAFCQHILANRSVLRLMETDAIVRLAHAHVCQQIVQTADRQCGLMYWLTQSLLQMHATLHWSSPQLFVQHCIQAAENVYNDNKSSRYDSQIWNYLCATYSNEWEFMQVDKRVASHDRLLLYECMGNLSTAPSEVIEAIRSALLQSLLATKSCTSRPFENCQLHRLRHRLASCLLLLCSYPYADFSPILLGLLDILQSEVFASVRQLIQWIIIRSLLSCADVHFGTILSCLDTASDSKPAYVCSLITMSTILARFASLDQTALHRFGGYLITWCSSQNHNTRLHCHLAMQFVSDLLAKDDCPILPIMQRALQLFRTNKQSVSKLTQLHDQFVWSRFHPLQDFNLEFILHVFPKLCKLSDEEIIPLSLLRNLPPLSVAQAPPANALDASGQLLNYASLQLTQRLLRIRVDRSDTSTEESDVQRKVQNWITLAADDAVRTEWALPEENQPPVMSSVVMVCSLLDKATNVGGLARSCEIFHVNEFVMDSLQMLNDKEFQFLSMTAEKWLNLVEVPRRRLFTFLEEKERDGFVLVGVEQTVNSKKLHEFTFPDKCVIVLGNEHEGLPADVLVRMHVCVEIPQRGVIRSLNVHVTGALVLWEHFKQSYLRRPTAVQR